MSVDHRPDDTVLSLLQTLPARDVAAHRAQLIRERCHARLTRRGWRERTATWLAMPWCQHAVEPALVGSLSLVFLAEVIRRALDLQAP